MSNSEDIQVQKEIVDGMTVLRPIGEIDLSRSPVLRHHLTAAQQSKPDRLIVDLKDVPYMDSSGVATLIEAMQNSRKHGTQLVLCELQDKVRSIFEIARLEDVFTIVNSREDAMVIDR